MTHPTRKLKLVHRFATVGLMLAASVFIAGCGVEPSGDSASAPAAGESDSAGSGATGGDAAEGGSGTTGSASSEGGSDSK